ncbi:ExeM/NucH family extracellular endonuclease [Solicola sp. PLA-1-18]|uniref:ExeM/NucH family extracellular endonuclease n=1 Tax=Solicola sp. PLA-1-18 TaxID=3380532 RepID=UPI003B769FC0
MRSLPRLGTALALVAGALATVPVASATAAPGGTGVVISEAYLSGGSAGAAYTNKFVELYNPTSAAVDVTGWSLQYRSASGTGAGTNPVTLSGTVPAKGHYLVAGGSNGTNGAALPTPDATGSINPSGTNGTLALVRTSGSVTLPTGSVRGDANVVDLLGYGSSNTFETKAATPPTGNTDVRSLNRATGGTDTDDNSADFSLSATITPTNSASGGTEPEPEPDPRAATIREIQGPGDTTPLDGVVVTTTGVVTAAYPTGGFRGVFVQTPGTGGDVDPATQGASDGLFVFGDAIASGAKIADHVEVTGKAGEFNGQTQVSLTSFRVLDEPAEAVKPAAVAYPRTEAQRESLEGMLVAPQGDYTIADNYDTNYYGSLGLASGTSPLVAPTEVARPGSPEAAAQAADNAARAVTLDDGATTNFNTQANKAIPLPYLAAGTQVRVGAAVTFTEPVILDYRFGGWNFQPTEQLTAENADAVQPATFEQTRTAAPSDVGGRVKVASFNVLNYFPTTGKDYEASAGTTCTYYTDRDGNPVTVNRCADGSGPRGAADQANLARQEVKIVTAINALGADVVGLEEIENSVVFGQDRDAALATLTAALNKAAGGDVWDYVRSPAVLPPTAEQDVIRLAFVYRKAKVSTVGDSQVLVGSEAFSNAREPLAQAFVPAGGTAEDRFAVIVNHFKSKGSGEGDDADTGDGQGGSVASRTRQATALVDFAKQFSASAGTDKLFLSGDFNSYSSEDPVQVLKDAGYVDLEERYDADETYLFDGQVGSLDHVYASPAAAAEVTGLDVWNINSVEPIANEYSRFNYNATNLYDESAFRSSDHDPVVVGFGAVRPAPPAPTVAANARAFCIGPRAFVAVYAYNDGRARLDNVRLTTPYGSKTQAGVQPRRAAYALFSTGSRTVPAGTASVRTYAWNDGNPASRTYSLPYAGVRCR